MRQVVFLLIFASCSNFALAESELPAILNEFEDVSLVPQDLKQKDKGILNQELSRESFRDPNQETIIVNTDLLPEVKADDLIKTDPEDDPSLPPMPTIGNSLASENKPHDNYVVLSKPSPVLLPDQRTKEAIADATITVIDGKFLKGTVNGKLKQNIVVKRDQNYEQYYSYSFVFNDLEPSLLDQIKFKALDLALNYKAKDANLDELELLLNELLNEQGLVLAKAEIVDKPKDSGSKLVLINVRGSLLNKLIINNQSDLLEEEISKAFEELKSGICLTKNAIIKPISKFNQTHSEKASISFRATDQIGKIDLVIKIENKEEQ